MSTCFYTAKRKYLKAQNANDPPPKRPIPQRRTSPDSINLLERINLPQAAQTQMINFLYFYIFLEQDNGL